MNHNRSIFQEWTNEDVENEMDLIVSAVRSLRSLAKESRERFVINFILLPLLAFEK